MITLRTRLVLVVAAVIWSAVACGVESPWLARSDYVEVPLLGEATVDVTTNDTVPDGTTVDVDTFPTQLELHAGSAGEVTVTNVGGSVGDRYTIGYEVTDGVRSTHGALIVRIVETVPTARLVVEPAEVDFGDVVVGTDRTHVVTVRLEAEPTRQVDAVVELVGSANLSANPSACTELTVGRACSIDVTWSPAALAGLEGWILVSADGLEPVSVDLRGRALPALEVSPTALDFGSVTVGDEAIRSVVIRNNSSQPLAPTYRSDDEAVEIRDDCGVVAGGASCEFEVRLITDEPIDVAALLTIDAGWGGRTTVAVDGQVTPVPVRVTSFEVSPEEVTLVGVSGRTVVDITNTGDVDLASFDVTGQPPWVTVSLAPSCTVLAPGGRCAVTLSHSRSLAASIEPFTIVVSSDGSSREVGVSVAPPVASLELDPSSIVLTRQDTSAEIRATNTGDVPLPVATMPSATDWLTFAPGDCSAELAPGATCTFVVSLTPAALRGARRVAATPYAVAAAPADATLDITIDVDGVPDFGVEPSSIYLPDNTLSSTITVSNEGETALPMLEFEGLTGFGEGGDGVLSVQNDRCVDLVEPGGSCTFDLRLDVFPNPAPTTTQIWVAGGGVLRSITVRLLPDIV